MATLIVEKDGVKTEYSVTQRQAEMLQEFKVNPEYTDKTEINGVKKSEIIGVIFDKVDKPFYYTVRLSYNDKGQDLTITKDELPMILWAFTKDTKAVCSGGAFRGKDIISIMPDYCKILGFNKGYELQPEDHRTIGNNHQCFEAREYLNNIKRLCLETPSFAEVKSKMRTLQLN